MEEIGEMMKNKIIVIVVLAFLLTFSPVIAQGEDTSNSRTMGLAIGMGLAAGLAAIGAGIGIGHIGAASIGAIAEKPEMKVWCFIFIAIAEGIALYGIVIAFILPTFLK